MVRSAATKKECHRHPFLIVVALVWTGYIVDLPGNVYKAGFKPADVCFDPCHEGNSRGSGSDEGAKNDGGDNGDCVGAHMPLFCAMVCNVATRKKGKPWAM